jgi:hypothetical protein
MSDEITIMLSFKVIDSLDLNVSQLEAVLQLTLPLQEDNPTQSACTKHISNSNPPTVDRTCRQPGERDGK